MLQHKMNRSNGNHGHDTSTTMSSNRNRSIYVKSFMQSIDPSIRGNQCNHRIPSSPQTSSTTASAMPLSLPFFPDPESFGMEPPSRTPTSLTRRKRGIEKHCSPSVSSISSVTSPFPSPPSTLFYSSNRSTSKSNAITVPCPRKTMFLSPTRAMARLANNSFTYSNSANHKGRYEFDFDGNGNDNDNDTQEFNNGLLLKDGSHNAYSNVVPFQQDNANKSSSMNKNHTFSITDNTSRYCQFPQHPNSRGLFEADLPVICRKSSPSLFQPPCTPESAIEVTMRTPPRALSSPSERLGLVTVANRPTTASTRGADAMVTNRDPCYTCFVPTTSASTPKRVSIDTRNKSIKTLPDADDKNADTSIDGETEDFGSVRQAIITAPMLRPQPSVGTTMAASALVSMMVTSVPQRDNSSSNAKRTLSFKAVGSSSPTKKCRMTPLRISNFLNEAPSASVERPKDVRTNEEDGENCKSLSNLSGHGVHSLFQKFNEKDASPFRYREESGKMSNSKHALGKIRLKSAMAFSKSSVPTSFLSVSTTIGGFKRIPRRFIDDPSLPVLKSGMRLAAPNDREELNSLHCFVRSELLEVFVLGDSKTSRNEKKENSYRCPSDKGAGRPQKSMNKNKNKNNKPGNQIQRVGIRCVHCGKKPKCQRVGTSMSAFFPKSLQDIYRGVCTWQRIHFQACKHIPNDLKELYKHYKDSDRSRGKKAHWVQSAHDIGFRNVDDHRNGVVWMGATSSSNFCVAMEETTGSGAVVGGFEHERVPRTPQRQAVTLDLTVLNNDIKAGAESDSRDDEIYYV